MFEQKESEQTNVTTESRLEELLKETLHLSQENNKILRRMERNALISFFAKIVLWLLLLGLPLFFLGPYLKPLFNLVTGAPSTSSSVPLGVPSEGQLQELLNLYSGQ